MRAKTLQHNPNPTNMKALRTLSMNMNNSAIQLEAKEFTN